MLPSATHEPSPARWLALSLAGRDRTRAMAPGHELPEGVNSHVRERLARTGRIHRPTLQSERLASKGYTNAEKGLDRDSSLWQRDQTTAN